MSSKTIVFLLSILGAIGICSHVFPQSYHFKHITTEDGLTTGNIRAITQDYQGFFWFGSEDGLHRYDGYEMKVYSTSPSDSTSISSNFVLSLFEDSQNQLWIGTIDGGLNLYNRQDDSFITFMHNPKDLNSIFGNYIRFIFETSQHQLFIGFESGGFSYFDPFAPLEDIKFQNFELPVPKSSFGANWVSSIAELANGKILLGTNGGGLYQFDIDKSTYEPFIHDKTTKDIHSLFIDHNNLLWIGTWQNGLYVYDQKNDRTAHFTSDDKLCHNQIEAISEDHTGNIWISTDNGINIINRTEDVFNKPIISTIQSNDFVRDGLLSNSAKAFYVDNENRIWIGTYYGGVNMYDPKGYQFNSIRAKSWEDNFLNHNNVFAFTEDHSQNLWIGTDGGGLSILEGGIKNIFDNKYTQVNLLGNKGKKEEKIKCLETDQQGNIWAGTWGGGMFKIDPKSLRVQHFYSDGSNNSLSANEVLVLEADDNDQLWIGTFHGGLNRLNINTGSIKIYKNVSSASKPGQIDKINAIHIDHKKRIFVSREVGGLNLYNPDTDDFTTIESGLLTKDLTIYFIAEDEKGKFWLGTNSNGLIYFDYENNIVKKFDESNGLANNVVYGVLLDDNENLWVSTNKGISFFDTKKETFINYSKEDGLQDNQFNHHSAFKAHNGKLLFGGIKGFNAFDADQITINSDIPNIVFTNFWLNNVNLSVNIEGSPLNENITTTSSITLQHDQNSFSIGFAALEYDFSERNFYAYKLEHFDKDWNYINKERKAVFTNLDPGTYNLVVKASNSDGFWGDNEKSLTIIIKPAWYQLSVFKLSLVLFILLVIYIIFKLRTNYLTKQKIKLAYEVKLRTSQLHEKNEELAKEKSLLDALMNNLPDYIYFKDLQSKFIRASRSMTKLFPIRDPKELDGKSDFDYHRKEAANKYFKEEQNIIKSKIGVIDEVRHEVMDTGFQQWVSTTKLPLIDQQGNVMGTFGITKDITQFKMLELEIKHQNDELTSQNDQISSQREQLQKAHKQLREINEQLEKLVDERTEKLTYTIKELDKTVMELDSFVYSASHDLSAPLKSIRGLLQIAKLDKTKTKTEEYFHYIENSIIKLEDVIQSLVEFSRNYHLDVKSEEINLFNLIEEVIKELSFWPDTKKVKFDIKLDKDLYVVSDPQRLKIIFHNIIGNCIKYADCEKDHSYVIIDYKMINRHHQISIRDNGIGIDEKRKEKIFEMYYRATEKSTGSGLGLYIVKETVYKLKGEVEVISEEYKGTEFVLTLPFKKVHDETKISKKVKLH